MSNFIDLDSRYRNLNDYPNPAKYVVEDHQVSAWSSGPRTVLANSNKPSQKMLEFNQSIRIKNMVLPWDDITYIVPSSTGGNPTTVTTHTADLSRVYLDVHVRRFDDKGLISTINSKITNARFALTISHIQYDSNNQPIFVHFHTHQDQVMRFSRNESIIVNIMQEDGYTIIIDDSVSPPNRLKQTWILIEVTPFFRDAEYENHVLGLTQL